LKSQANISTLSGPRIIRRLSKHWSHRFAVTESDGISTIRFDDASFCALSAYSAELEVILEARDASAMGRLEEVVAEHLQRMDQGSTLEIQWKPVGN
jgi:uncharacterized protein